MTARSRSPVLAALLVAAVAAHGDRAGAALKLKFSYQPAKETAKDNIQIRPNLQQPVYVFVESDEADDKEVTVEVRAGGKTADGGSATLTAKKGAVTPVPFGQSAEKAKPAEKPAEKPKPPTLAELAGVVEFVLLDAKDKKELDRKTGLSVRRPADYVRPSVTYVPSGEDGKPTLRVRVVTLPEFAGPPCRVELVLPPERNPNLDPTQPRTGTYAGYLGEPKPGKTSTLDLEAQDLKFTGQRARLNLIYLTVDGYERAFAYKAFFTPTGQLEEQPRLITDATLRLVAPAAADPSKPLAVTVEADNVGNGKPELALGRVKDDEFKPENDELVREFHGNRQETLLFGVDARSGALLFKPELRDWTATLDAKDIFGDRALRVVLNEPKRDPFYDSAADATVTQILRPVILDATPPVPGQLLYNDKTPRGKPLVLGATAEDKESGIKQVVFYVGKPDKDGKPPPGAVKVDAVRKGDVWYATLDAPTDAKGKVEVTMVFTNRADLSTTKTVEIVLVDPAPPGPPGKPSISGIVVEGDRPQPKVAVALRNATTSAPVDATTTNDKGEYVFKDVPPGSYVVAANKTNDGTKGESAVTVVDKDKKGVDIKLTR